MLLGLIGSPCCGRTTVFRLLLGGSAPSKGDVGRASVLDPRLDALAALFQPRKLVHANLDVKDCPSTSSWSGDAGAKVIAELRNVDALGIVLGGGGLDDLSLIQPELENTLAELLLQDQMVVENRLTRLATDLPRAKPEQKPLLEREREILNTLKQELENGNQPDLTEYSTQDLERLRNYALFILKPKIAIINLPEELLKQADEVVESVKSLNNTLTVVAICALLELEAIALSESDRDELLGAYGISEAGAGRITRGALTAGKRIHFFTVGADEVRAWEVTQGVTAQKAAGAIHSDLERGFIRAEICPWQAMLEHHGWAGAKTAALARTEGREYIVKDGDIMEVRHSG